MHSPIAPVFASLARGDSYRVDPWIVALCSGRVAVASDDGDEAAAVEAIHHCRALIAFVSSAAAEGGPVATDIAQCQAANTPVIIMLLDDTDVSECSERATVIDVRRTGRRESWDLLIKDLARHGVRWRDPDVQRFWQKKVINERRSAIRARRWAYIAAFLWIALALGYVFFLRPAEKEAPKAIAVPTPTLSVETPPPSSGHHTSTGEPIAAVLVRASDSPTPAARIHHPTGANACACAHGSTRAHASNRAAIRPGHCCH